MSDDDGMISARRFKTALEQKGYPIQKVLLYGSYAKGTPRVDSDIDIAVISKPFLKTRMDEMGEFFFIASNIDLRIEPICLHPEDLDEKYSTIVQEVKRTGIVV